MDHPFPDPPAERAPGPEGVWTEEDVLETVRRLEAGEAAGDPALRLVLGEVSDALAAAGASVGEAVEAGPPSDHVRAAALEAFRHERLTGPVEAVAPAHGGARSVSREPIRAARPARLGLLPLQAAALVLVGLGIALWFAVSGSPDAEAGIHLGSVHRVNLAQGRPEVSSGRWLAPGERIEAQADEVVGLRLLDGTTVALDGQGALSVATTDGDDARLHLIAGQACISAGPTGFVLALESGVRLVVDHGSAWLGSDPAAAALAAGARGRVIRPDGTATEMVGPAWLVLDAAPSAEQTVDPVGTNRFRSLALFSPSPTGAHPGRLVDAGRWRVPGGGARRTGHRLRVEPSGEARTARVAWRPSPSVREAGRLDVVLNAPTGTRVSVPALGASGVVGEAAVSSVPGRRTIALALPCDWYARLEADGREIEIEIQWPKGRDEPVLFEGTTFLFGGADTETTRG